MASFKDAIERVLKNEGSYVDNGADAGGIKNYGITLRFLQTIEKNANKDSIKNLTIEQAEDLYFQYF